MTLAEYRGGTASSDSARTLHERSDIFPPAALRMSFCKTEARQLPCTVARGKTFGTRCCADAASNSPSRSVARILKLRRHGGQTFQARPVPERVRLALLRYRPL